MAIIKKLVRHGNSLALVIDKAVLELLNIDADTPLEVNTDGQVLVIAPAGDRGRRERFEVAVRETNEEYGRMLKRLSQWVRADFEGLADNRAAGRELQRESDNLDQSSSDGLVE